MITKNPMQLKAFIKNKAAEKHISAQLVMQNYMPVSYTHLQQKQLAQEQLPQCQKLCRDIHQKHCCLLYTSVIPATVVSIFVR